MNFNKHSAWDGRHAVLSASKHSWVHYDRDKMAETYIRWMASQRGTALHDLAERCIRLGVKLPQNESTLNMYVNDALHYHMTPEQILWYSRNCFGTADAIAFDDGLLRIHDLKTGIGKASMDQLLIYSALFCLEYEVNPNDIQIVLRIYQNDQIEEEHPDPRTILDIKAKIIDFDHLIEEIKAQEG